MNDDDRLRQAWATPPALGGDLPDPERIWAALDGALSPDAVAEVVEQVARSPEWAEAWRIAVAMRRDAGLGIPEALRTIPEAPIEATGEVISLRRALRWVVPLALAAGALLVAWPFVGTSERQGEVPVYRAGVLPKVEVLAPADAELPRADLRLGWRAVGEARYDVVVTDEALNPVYTVRGVERTEVRIPAEAIGDRPDGTRLLWRVVALSEDGERVGSASSSVVVR